MSVVVAADSRCCLRNRPPRMARAVSAEGRSMADGWTGSKAASELLQPCELLCGAAFLPDGGKGRLREPLPPLLSGANPPAGGGAEAPGPRSGPQGARRCSCPRTALRRALALGPTPLAFPASPTSGRLGLAPFGGAGAGARDIRI
jgi:hypothetical protein